ncbi:MAG: cysteine hydrolase [Chloroflexi bacterium]|nr:cysteine hydrolase [Chloroflexota bacterium]
MKAVAFGDDFYRIGTWREYVMEVPWPRGSDFQLEPARTALIVVDMTLSRCDKDAPSGVSHSLHKAGGKAADYYLDTQSKVIPVIRELANACRERGVLVVYLTLGPYFPDAGELPFFMRSMNQGSAAGGHHFEVIPELRPQEGDLVIHKLTASGFIGTNLDGILRNLGIDTVILTGAATHACVESTARTAADFGYRIVLVEDGCVTQSPLWHDMTMMNCVHFNWGKVLQGTQVIDELSASPRDSPLR